MIKNKFLLHKSFKNPTRDLLVKSIPDVNDIKYLKIVDKNDINYLLYRNRVNNFSLINEWLIERKQN